VEEHEKKLMGQRIKEERKRKNMSQDELADILGMKRTNVSNYESGRTIPPGDVLKRLAEIFGVESDYILGASNIRRDVYFEAGSVAENRNPYYVITEKDEKDIAKQLEAMMENLDSNAALSFMGEPMDEEDRELLRISLENTLRMSREMAKKKFTPKKYRK